MTEPVTFKDMPYARPDLAEVKARYAELASRLADAETFEAAETAFLEKDQLDRHVQTAYELVYIRHTIDTRDAFYDAESTFWDEAMPELEQAEDAFKAALLSTPFRARLAEKYGELLFAQAEQQRRTIKPEIVEDMKRENALAQEYMKLIGGRHLHALAAHALQALRRRRRAPGRLEGRGRLVQGAPGRPRSHLRRAHPRARRHGQEARLQGLPASWL